MQHAHLHGRGLQPCCVRRTGFQDSGLLPIYSIGANLAADVSEPTMHQYVALDNVPTSLLVPRPTLLLDKLSDCVPREVFVERWCYTSNWISWHARDMLAGALTLSSQVSREERISEFQA